MARARAKSGASTKKLGGDRVLGARLHRDLKPENCLIVQRHGRDHLILLDLGLAKIHTGPLLSLAPSSAPGVMTGTLAYVSPEQAREQPLTSAADIYAVGVILFELLTRRVPFPGTKVLEVLSAHASEQAPSVTERAPDRGISDDLEALVASALDKDPARRPASADVFRRALEVAAEQPTAAFTEPASLDGGLARQTPENPSLALPSFI